MDPVHLTDILLAALVTVMGYVGKVALDTRTLARELKVKLDEHLTAHRDGWDGAERRRH